MFKKISLAFFVLAFYAYSYIGRIRIDVPGHGIASQLDLTVRKPFAYRALCIGMLQLGQVVGIPVPWMLWIITFSAMAVASWSVWTLAHRYAQQRQAWMAPIVMFGMVTVIRIAWVSDAIYDMPQLAIFAVGYVLIFRESAMFWPLFIVASLNKETSCFLSVVYAIHYYRRMPLVRYVFSGILQVCIWMLVHWMVGYIFRNNGGVEMGHHIEAMVRMFTVIPHVMAMYGLLFAGILYAISRQWSKKLMSARIAFGVLLIAFIILFWIGGSPMEFRVFYEVVPLATLLLLPPPITESTNVEHC